MEEQASAAAPLPQNFSRRDKLRAIEATVRDEWEAHKVFEADADPTKEKFFVTFPFPYMNGRLHLGHAFSLTKADFTAAYQRLLGKNVLFPFGFHCTGMPIQGAAYKLRMEMQQYGTPPVVPSDDGDDDMGDAAAQAEVAAAESNAADAAATTFKSKKTKTARKTGGAKLQWDILKMSGIPESDIPAFADPVHWLDYFPSLGEDDLRRFGCHIDWRRSFITTSENPFFDRFVRWQFMRLRDAGMIDFGRRPTVYSPLDKQACTDHDRSRGEGVGPQEYTLIKLRVLELRPEALAGCDAALAEHVAAGTVFMVAATLRPETMYGQTNCFVLPAGEYGAFAFDVQRQPGSAERETQVYITSARAARNMSWQDPFAEPARQGEVRQLGSMTGAQLIGTPLRAPKTPYERVYTLPLLSISMTKGTGVVTSVPSDAPDDFAALRDLQRDEKLRAKHGVTEDMVAPFEVVPVIDIPGLGDRAAVTLVERLKIKSQHDEKKLKEAKAEAYKKGFYEGIMVAGEADGVRGMKVAEAKDRVKELMLRDGEAMVYFEPESEVTSRSGEDCVVSYLDQWYLKYGDPKWRDPLKAYVSDPAKFTPYTEATRKAFMEVLDWLQEWACSRSFGLGTLVPWDEQFVIESLSDSTIYMAYYTLSHLLQGRKDKKDYTGAGGSPLGIKPEQLTPEVLDFVMLEKPYPGEACGVPEEALRRLRTEFEYWYPLDLRVSGRDLIRNHLTMALYNHAAIWPERHDRWPQGFYANGFIEVENKKMSKSEGNFILLDEAVAGHRVLDMDGKQMLIGWSADATRLALASAGDSLDDANFSCELADRSILRLTTELDWATENMTPEARAAQRSAGPAEYNFFEKAFDAQMDVAAQQTQAAYEAMRFRDVAKCGLYELQGFRDSYRDACERQGLPLNAALVEKYLETLSIIMSPVCPHFFEHVWREVLGRPGFVAQARWPASAAAPDVGFVRAVEFLNTTIRNVRVKAEREAKVRAKKNVGDGDPEPVTRATIHIAEQFPAWHQEVVRFVASTMHEGSFPEDIMKQLKDLVAGSAQLRPHMKDAMKTAAQVMAAAAEIGAAAMELTVPYDQRAVLEDNRAYVASAMQMEGFECVVAAEDDVAAKPGDPRISFE